MSDLDPSALFTRLARVLAGSDTSQPLELRLCRACLSLLGGDGAAITLSYTDPDRVTLCTTDDTAARLEDLQDVLGEGPGTTAYQTAAIAVADLSSDQESWPLFTDAAREIPGASVVYAVPMLPGGSPLGVLTVHYAAGADLPEPSRAQYLADTIGAALVEASPAHDADWRNSSWASRAEVHQATGMVVAQLRISPEDALALLRAHAFSHDSTLTGIAAQIISRRLRFSDDPESETP